MECTRPRWLVSGAADQARPATSLWPANTAAAGVVATSVSARRCRSVSHAAQVSTNPTARMASLASISMSAAPGPTFGSDALLAGPDDQRCGQRSEEHTSELQSLMRSSNDVFGLKKNTNN